MLGLSLTLSSKCCVAQLEDKITIILFVDLACKAALLSSCGVPHALSTTTTTTAAAAAAFASSVGF